MRARNSSMTCWLKTDSDNRLKLVAWLGRKTKSGLASAIIDEWLEKHYNDVVDSYDEKLVERGCKECSINSLPPRTVTKA